ncbi:MAG TPA: TIGR03067 domain-containing protein [Gemmata sp.]
MRTLLALSLVGFVVGLSTAADDKKDPTAGKWIVESVTRDGKPVDALKGAVREHTNGKYTLTPAQGSKAQPTSGSYTLDLSKTPATIDMMVKGGTYDGKTLHGIAKLDGDTLTVAFGEPGKDRPTKFESTAGSGVVVAVHKKAK